MAYVAAEDRYDGTGMHYRRTGRSGLRLPALSLGLWQNFGGADVFETGRAILRRAFDRGVTHFDLANNYGPPYGSAEENFGRVLAADLRHHRDELVISTKAGWDMWPGPYGQGGGSRKYVLASLDQSLARLGLDYVDIFYSHRFDPDTPVEETVAALDTAVRSSSVSGGASSASRLVSSCATLEAPMTALVTRSSRSTHCRASWASFCPRASAIWLSPRTRARTSSSRPVIVESSRAARESAGTPSR